MSNDHPWLRSVKSWHGEARMPQKCQVQRVQLLDSEWWHQITDGKQLWNSSSSAARGGNSGGHTGAIENILFSLLWKLTSKGYVKRWNDARLQRVSTGCHLIVLVIDTNHNLEGPQNLTLSTGWKFMASFDFLGFRGNLRMLHEIQASSTLLHYVANPTHTFR